PYFAFRAARPLRPFPLPVHGGSVWPRPCCLGSSVRLRRSAAGLCGVGTPGAQALGDGPLVPAIGGLVVASARERVGQVLLADQRVGMVVGVLVVPPVPELLHEGC